MASGWEILKVTKSTRNMGVRVEGINHETTNPLFRTFAWHVESLTADTRYFLAPHAEIAPDAHAVLDRIGWPRRAE